MNLALLPLALILALVTCSTDLARAAQPAEPASLQVQVMLASVSGAPPPAGGTAPGPTVTGPDAGAVVRVLDPNAPDAPIAEQVVGSDGQAVLSVPPGQYWLVVPWDSPNAAPPGSVIAPAALPDGQQVQAWTTADTATATDGVAELRVMLLMP